MKNNPIQWRKKCAESKTRGLFRRASVAGRWAGLALAAACSGLAPMAQADSLVVFNELMYHPATNEPALEWVELYDQASVDLDLSGWRLDGGIHYTFPNGTVIHRGACLVVAISPATLAAQTGLTNVLGPFTGRLSNAGETLELRDNAGRLMDSMKYGVGGRWPVGPDGSGVSLAKRQPNLASGPAENWVASTQTGGTPGSANFSSAPLLGSGTNLVSLASTWRYDDSGADQGAAWRNPAFDDTAWASGTPLFYGGNTPLPAPTNTPLAPGQLTYYFRTTFPCNGDPAMKVLSLRPLAQDGAVIYLNGVEVYRLNMPTGLVNYSTLAASAVPAPSWSGPVNIPSTNLVAGSNVLAVELHRTTVQTNAGLRLNRAGGYTIAWDGNDGDFFSPDSPARAPTNAALAALGVDVFVSSNTNLAANLNDGFYGSSSSWSPATNDFNPSIVLRFNQAIPVSSIAWSRDNGNTNEPACGGTCTDRALGNCTLQYTLVTNPAAITASSGNPSNGWVSIATVQYISAQPGFTPSLRHRFDVATTNGNPILATGVRLRPTFTNTLDEIEINPPVVPRFRAAFGLELSATDILPPPPRLVFNEVSAASSAAFWLELINCGDAPAELAGVEIVRSTGGSPGYVFPAQTLPPGGLAALPQTRLGFGAADGDKLFLYTPGRFLLLDAVTVKTSLRGRNPDGSGDWMYPALPSPGVSNFFMLHDEIVLNEIMYHHRPFDPVPAVTSNATLQPLTGPWRYNDTGADLGATWRAPDYDDGAWPSGPALFYVNTGGLPAATNTALAPGRTTYYFRTTFDSDLPAGNALLNLRTIVDDGAIFYLNGLEVYRQNMPAGPASYTNFAATAVGNATINGPIALSVSNLVRGRNILAVEVHQAAAVTNWTGLVLSGDGLRLVEEGPLGGTPPMNLARQPGAAPFVIDSLAGYPIHDYTHLDDGVYGNPNSWIGNSGNPGYAGIRFGGLYTISGFAFGRDNTGTYSDRTLGTYTLQYTRVTTPGTTTTVTGNPDTGWAPIGTLNYQNAGVGLFSSPSRRHRYTFNPVDATGIRLVVPGTGIASGTCIDELEVNPPDSTGDIAFAAELVLTTILAPAVPFTKSTEEWLELYNRGSATVDLSGWQLDDAIHYLFPAATTLAPGGYLVVANDAAALQTKWPEVASNILGDFSGKLGGGDTVVLKDAAGNPANTFQVLADGWSDGGGSSLELTDPRADNSNPEAWADSDESTRSGWQTVTYRMTAHQTWGATFWNEFRLGLLDPGEVLVDDVSVIRDPDGTRQQLIQNGDFEATGTNTHWRCLGDHGLSQIIVDPDNPANHVLKVVATDPPRTSHNHIESSFVGNTPIADGQEYEVSYRARWLAGSPQLNTCAYMARLARTSLLTLPPRHGTPGMVNSRRVPNAGPTFTDLKHSPVIPQTNQPVTISVRASDPDGVVSATVNYRVNPGTNFASVPMALQPDGTWAASLPGQVAGTIVQFYVTAQDSLGATAFAPAKGPDSRALYQVADKQGTNLPAHELRVIQLDADRDFVLNATNVMSQAFIGATAVYDRSEVFYDAGLRLHGSAAGRARDGDDYICYSVAFPPDHLFRGLQSEINIDRSGRSPVVRQQDEIYILHMFHRAGIPCHYSDLCYFIAPKTNHTGTAILQLAVYGAIYVREQYNTDGAVFNYDMTYEPSVTVNGNYEGIKLPVPLQPQLGTDFTDLGNDKEQYRAPFDMRHGTREDYFSGVIRLCQALGLPQAQVEGPAWAALDVDEAMRITALTILCGIGDHYFSPVPSNPHNIRIFTPSDGGLAHFLPWDMDFVFYLSSSSSIFLDSSFNVSKLMASPAGRRLYLSHVNDLCQTVFTPDYMSPWLAHYGSVVGQNYTGSASYIQNRRASALGQLPAVQPFAVTSNRGNPFLTNTSAVTITGAGWLDVGQIWLANGTSPLAVTWSTVTNWQATVPLLLGTNLLTFVAYDRASNVLASRSIIVTTSATGGGVDTDGDGMPDAWELAHGLNPLVNDANLDLDGDGSSNLQEYLAGTDPAVPHSYLRLEATNDAAGLRLSLLAVAGRSYSVLGCDSLTSGAWVKVADVAAQVADRTVNITPPPPAQQRFYRLVTPQQP